jgi:hypothetical protein
LASVAITALSALAATSAASADKAKSIYFVGVEQGKSPNADAAVKAHLETLGYVVTRVEPAPPPKDICRYDAVVISSSISAMVFPDGYQDVGVPLLTWEADMIDELHFTARREGVDFGEVPLGRYLRIVNAPHPMAAGKPAGTTFIYIKEEALGWGKVAPAAQVIATYPGEPDKAMIFGYEKGATMDYDFIAPARRAFLPLNNNTFHKLQPDGIAFFDAAIKWLVDGGKGKACTGR